MHPDWIEHRRAHDGERVGWIRPADDGFVAIDLLGRERTGVVDWLDAEAALDELGLSFLADPFELRVEGEWVRVRLSEVSPDGIRVKLEDWGDMTAPQIFHDASFPLDAATLRPLRRTPPDAGPFLPEHLPPLDPPGTPR